MTGTDENIAVGVIGVGSMGRHHTRVYSSLPGVELIGVYDADEERASNIATKHETQALGLEELLAAVDAVSIAVPTAYHYSVASKCLDHGVDILVEKPFVNDTEEGRELLRQADEQGALIQVGHVERFNPAVLALEKIVPDLDIISVNAERLGPPLEREIEDSAILDLMIHDIDIVLSLLDECPATIESAGVRENRHATATMTFDSETIARLTASRMTQKKVRKLEIVAEDCLVSVDYIDRSVEIHRQSTPSYITRDDELRYRHESIVERPMVGNGEPLANELESFVETVRTRDEPKITGEDGLRALHIANLIEEADDSTDRSERYTDDTLEALGVSQG